MYCFNVLIKIRWLMRARIRIALEGQNLNLQPIELHDQVLNNLEFRYFEHVEENRQMKIGSNKNATDSSTKMLNIIQSSKETIN